MSIRTFSVTLTDLGTYTLDVAAFNEDHACEIAKQVLHDFASTSGSGPAITSRYTDAIATVSEPQPERTFSVKFWQRIQHEMHLTAVDADVALKQAEWLIAQSGPLEFDIVDERVGEISAEVVS